MNGFLVFCFGEQETKVFWCIDICTHLFFGTNWNIIQRKKWEQCSCQKLKSDWLTYDYVKNMFGMKINLVFICALETLITEPIFLLHKCFHFIGPIKVIRSFLHLFLYNIEPLSDIHFVIGNYFPSLNWSLCSKKIHFAS